jgi:5-(carboxyamino)imidazole ribonucleotide mutase
MPAGVPVATMAIGKSGARNAGILAAQILALKYPEIQKTLKDYRIRMTQEIEKKDQSLQKSIVTLKADR